ncbi:hypothetical protein D3C85_1303090 [compost metagenome]
MLQTVDVGTECGTCLTNIFGEGVQLVHGGGCLSLIVDTGGDGSAFATFAGTFHFCQSRCQRTASSQLELFS